LIFEIVSHMTIGEGLDISGWLMMLTGIVIAACIAYFAWKLPEEEA
jgi:hypothetical protein